MVVDDHPMDEKSKITNQLVVDDHPMDEKSKRFNM